MPGSPFLSQLSLPRVTLGQRERERDRRVRDSSSFLRPSVLTDRLIERVMMQTVGLPLIGRGMQISERERENE